jgi:hypothetical protein
MAGDGCERGEMLTAGGGRNLQKKNEMDSLASMESDGGMRQGKPFAEPGRTQLFAGLHGIEDHCRIEVEEGCGAPSEIDKHLSYRKSVLDAPNIQKNERYES